MEAGRKGEGCDEFEDHVLRLLALIEVARCQLSQQAQLDLSIRQYQRILLHIHKIRQFILYNSRL